MGHHCSSALHSGDPGHEGLPGWQAVPRRLQEGLRRLSPDPYSIYGYESAELGIQALAKLPAGFSQAQAQLAFVKQLFKTKNLKSVLGTFSINASGDTTLTSYGLYKLAPTNGGKTDTLMFYKTLKPPKF